MSKQPGQFNWKLILGLISVGAVVYTTVGGDDSAKSSKKTAKKSSKSAADAAKDLYTDADRKASFAALTDAPKDSFIPLVVKKGKTGNLEIKGGLGAAGGGEPWVFTGTPELDGVRNALIENTATGEGVFLKTGDHWKQVTVGAITSDTLTLIDADGAAQVIPILDPTTLPANVAKGGTVAPVQPPPLRGDIGAVSGAAMAVQGDTGMTIDQTGQGNGGNGRRRGRRGNRGQGTDGN